MSDARRIDRRFAIARALGNRRAAPPGPAFVSIGMFGLVEKLRDAVPAIHLAVSPFIGEARPIETVARYLLEELRRQRPEGPYFLGGHCFGGLVALEVARALVASGQRVAWLCLFETSYPGRLADRLHRPRQLGLALSRPRFALEMAKRRWIDPGRTSARPDLFSPWARAALRGYRPRPYEGEVTLAFADRSSARILPRAGWRDVLPAATEVRVFPGDHMSFLSSPEVTAMIAARVR